jgi:hypothetical protein
MKVFDEEFYPDCAVFVFKEYGKNEYDVFVDSTVDITTLSLRKSIALHTLDELIPYFCKNKRKLVGFFNQAYDNQLLMMALKKKVGYKELYEYNKSLIEGDKSKKKFYRDYNDKEISKYFSYIDLYKVNHYDFRGRQCSLKKLEFNYRRKSIKDLPYPIGSSINTKEKLSKVILYCCEDVDVTEECYDKTLPAIKHRLLLNKDYENLVPGFNSLNWSDVKIGDYENLYHYCKETGLTEEEVRGSVPDYSSDTILYSDCIPDFIHFSTLELKSFYEDLVQRTVKVSDLGGDKKDDFKDIVVFDGVEYTVALGGIHSKDVARKISSDKDYVLVEADCGSQYPSELIKRELFPRHLCPKWIKNLASRVKERLYKWKPKAKVDPYSKSMADRIKISANGGAYGKLKEPYSWQYDPQIALSVTLSCQLQILMLVEMLYIRGIHTLSANTDGILVRVKRTQIQEFHNICIQWEKLTLNTELGKLEFSECEFIAQTGVNDYILKKVSGEVKRKGDFMIYEDITQDNWHKDSSARIIPMALEKYFLEGTPVEETVNSHNDIHDFCLGVSKTRAFTWLISTLTPNGVISNHTSHDRFIRYFVGGYSSISKSWKDRDGFTQVEATTPVTLAQTLSRSEIIKGNNKYPSLNRNWYIYKAKKLIKNIEDGNV